MRYWVNLISLYTASVAISNEQKNKKKHRKKQTNKKNKKNRVNETIKQLFQTEKYLIMGR